MTVQAVQSAGIDTPATLEFMGEILSRLDRADLSEMATLLEAKSAWTRALFSPQRSGPLDEERIYTLLRSFFPSRRKARAILDAVGPQALEGAFVDLLHGQDPLIARLATFEEALPGFEEVTVDLGWEVLHTFDPQRYWLWTRWMWNPRTETGALRLVTADETDLYDEDRFGAYLKVGAALAVVQETARALGLVDESCFGVDVFLACVYGVYMYTVLRMRMSQEFNRIVPELPSLARRLLGINERTWEVA